ncbi:MAG: TonB-dependent receptor plug domain-containing protein, partial [Rhodanobacteraceae bacterium]
TTTTARQLEALPLSRSSGSIALLAPGVSEGAPMLGSGPLGSQLLVFGGASVAENAYYIDGMNTTDQITGQGGITMPYGSLLQQQTFTSGYGAKYGRSIGGVINQIGKSGSNEWHFGARAIWEPSSWRSAPDNQYYDNPLYTLATLGPDSYNPAQAAGQPRAINASNSAQVNIYDAYVSGPIIKNKLTFFLSAEQANESGGNASTLASAQKTFFNNHAPKIYAKINWNINENNQLSISGLQNSEKSWSSVYDYNAVANSVGDFVALNQTTKDTFRVWVANYTSFITDNLTLHAMFGKTHGEYFTMAPSFPGFDASLPHIAGPSSQNPAFLPPSGPVVNSQTRRNIASQDHRDSITNYRVDLDYKLGNHDLAIGIDNLTTYDINDGEAMTGPGYEWNYGKKDPTLPIVGFSPGVAPYVGPTGSVANGSSGYYVEKEVFATAASVKVAQRAWYIEDKWQVTPNFLLDLGVRDDQFTNYNPSGQAYIRLTKPQWGPRIGFAWDVHGDSTLKVFGNAGRYYLALPSGVALRGAAGSNYYGSYYTYTGIDPNTGEPLGLTQIAQNNGGQAAFGVSANNEYGQAPDPRAVASQNIKAEYSDNFSLGMQQAFHFNGQKYVFGANAILEKMGPDIVDDWDDEHAICATAIAQGMVFPGDPATGLTPISQCTNLQPGAVLVNPTQDSDIFVKDPAGNLHLINVTNADQLFTSKVKRKYYAVNLSLEHPFDGKWYGKLIYTWSRSYGNTEGPVDSIIGQGGTSVSITEQWDFWQLMDHSMGVLPLNHTNQLKAYGFYQLNPQWQVSANVFIESGAPSDCLGGFGPGETDPYGYGSAYHWCGGVPASPGSTGNTPWTHSVNLGVTYTPAWAEHKLAFNLSVQNLLNNQTVTQFYPSYGTSGNPSAFYHLEQGRVAPRLWRLEASYNW